VRSITASILLAALAACTNPVRFHKAGATDADYQRDKKACEAQAKRAASGQMAPQAAAASHNRVLLACMHDRGWRQVTE
jgi:hypothetical protein